MDLTYVDPIIRPWVDQLLENPEKSVRDLLENLVFLQELNQTLDIRDHVGRLLYTQPEITTFVDKGLLAWFKEEVDEIQRNSSRYASLKELYPFWVKTFYLASYGGMREFRVFVNQNKFKLLDLIDPVTAEIVRYNQPDPRRMLWDTLTEFQSSKDSADGLGFIPRWSRIMEDVALRKLQKEWMLTAITGLDRATFLPKEELDKHKINAWTNYAYIAGPIFMRDYHSSKLEQLYRSYPDLVITKAIERAYDNHETWVVRWLRKNS